MPRRWMVTRSICTLALCALSLCSGCFHSNLAHEDACYNRCQENDMQCNRETGYCERIPCGGYCPRGTSCDAHADECVSESW